MMIKQRYNHSSDNHNSDPVYHVGNVHNIANVRNALENIQLLFNIINLEIIYIKKEEFKIAAVVCSDDVNKICDMFNELQPTAYSEASETLSENELEGIITKVNQCADLMLGFEKVIDKLSDLKQSGLLRDYTREHYTLDQFLHVLDRQENIEQNSVKDGSILNSKVNSQSVTEDELTYSKDRIQEEIARIENMLFEIKNTVPSPSLLIVAFLDSKEKLENVIYRKMSTTEINTTVDTTFNRLSDLFMVANNYLTKTPRYDITRLGLLLDEARKFMGPTETKPNVTRENGYKKYKELANLEQKMELAEKFFKSSPSREAFSTLLDDKKKLELISTVKSHIDSLSEALPQAKKTTYFEETKKAFHCAHFFISSVDGFNDRLLTIILNHIKAGVTRIKPIEISKIPSEFDTTFATHTIYESCKWGMREDYRLELIFKPIYDDREAFIKMISAALKNKIKLTLNHTTDEQLKVEGGKLEKRLLSIEDERALSKANIDFVGKHVKIGTLKELKKTISSKGEALTQVEGYFRRLKVLQDDIMQYNKDVAIKVFDNRKTQEKPLHPKTSPISTEIASHSALHNDGSNAEGLKNENRKSKFGLVSLFSPSKQTNSNNFQPQLQPPQATPKDTGNKTAKGKVQDQEISLTEFKPGVRNSQ